MTQPESANLTWKGLYRVGGVAILIAVVVFRRNFGAEMMGFRGFGIFDVPATAPSSAIAWFALLQNHRFVGLALLDGVDIVNYALVGLMFLALYGALKRTDTGAVTVATAFGLAGMAVYFASNQALAMLSLSDQHAAAATETQKSIFVAAGQALLANTNQRTVGGFNVGLFLVSIAGWIVSASMLRSKSFSRSTAYVGIAANVLSLLDYLRQALTSS